jgi:hypothetical protein
MNASESAACSWSGCAGMADSISEELCNVKLSPPPIGV